MYKWLSTILAIATLIVRATISDSQENNQEETNGTSTDSPNDANQNLH